MKNFFGKLLVKGEGFFKQNISVEQPLWVYCAVVGGMFIVGFIVGKL